MALDYVRNGDDPRLLQIAREIATYQSSEIGMMNEYLAQWGQRRQPARDRRWAGCSRRSRATRCPGSRRKAQMDAARRPRAAPSSTSSSPS